MASTRRLAAILAADVVGYSRLMGADEEGTHERLKAHFAELIEPKIREYGGRTVKNTGDGVLADFVSVVDAVRCAAEIQRGMIHRELDFPEDRHISFRIGVNLGDIIVEDHDIFGDGVNIAARLEGLDRLPYAFEDIGEQSVKNIARAVRVYVLRPEDIAGLPMEGVSTTMSSSPFAAAPRLSIVVLPFTNLGDDREQQYFADGITEDLTTDLSRIAHSFVISRNTAFTYRNKAIDTKQIGRELGVRYVLEGSVRRLGSRIRVSAQLIDAATDAHLWADRFDADTADLFTLQSDITSRLANALGVELIAAEAARPREHPDALDYILRGRAVLLKPRTPENRREAIDLYERALALDPQSVEARSRLAAALVSPVHSGMTASAAGNLARAKGLVDQVLAVSPRNALAHFTKGHVLRLQKRCVEAIPEYETALALDHNLMAALTSLGWCKLCAGSIEQVTPLAEQAIRLSPRDPNIGWCYHLIGIVHLLLSRTDEAVVWLEKARNASPGIPVHHSDLASAYALGGKTERAAMELAEARRLEGGDLFSSISRLKAFPGEWWGVPKVQALFEATYFAGLRKAGMPEE